MKAKRIFVTIEFDSVPGIFDYPKDAPLPRIGDNVIFENYQVNRAGNVYEVRHIVTDGLVDIKIKVRQ